MSSAQLLTHAPVPVYDTARRQRLQAATRAAHGDVDGAILTLLGRGRAGYGAYLAAMRTVRAPLEAHLLATGSPVSAFIEPIVPLMAQDLAVLEEADTPRPAIATDDPVPQDVGELWGAAYVLAGASLGAPHILRRVAPLGVDGVRGARHLARQAEAARHWPGFVEALEAAPLTPAQDARCISAAIAVFAAFGASFAAHGSF